MREKQAELKNNYSEFSDKETRNLKLQKNCTIEEVIESYRELQKIENYLYSLDLENGYIQEMGNNEEIYVPKWEINV